MSAKRLPAGGEINRGKALRFTFDGQPVLAYEGDTFAAALLAAGHKVVARSFKYRRPRGIFAAGAEEPNAYADLRKAGETRINLRLTTELAVDGAELRSASTAPSALHDRTGMLDLFARFIPSGFYYKTFIWPNWHLFEPHIREMAGLGRVDVTQTGPEGEQKNHHCDAVVVGAGPVGIATARMLAEAGQKVLLCDEASRMGGSLLSRDAVIDGLPGRTWARQNLDALQALGVTLLPLTTAFGIYDHNLIALNQRRADGSPDLLWRVRAGRILLATGAIDRPLPFDRNDLPGIMSAQGALTYLRRYGVLVGERLVLATNNAAGAGMARAFCEAGAEVVLVDSRPAAAEISAPGLRHLRGVEIRKAFGRKAVTHVQLSDDQTLTCDTVLVSGGLTPSIHLYAQAKGKLRFDDQKLALVPDSELAGITVLGAARGDFALDRALAALPAALGLPEAAVIPAEGTPWDITPAWPTPGMKGRVWIDYQHDVTTKDVALAARENFVSVEHLKRYTTLGMATDQGKTSNLNGLALMGQLTGRTIPEVGTTTYRPPFTPVPYVSLAGNRGGERMNPLRRLAVENQHRAAGASFGEYGGWLRPAWYGCDESAIMTEARLAREHVGLFDASPLGKIEVIGPDAAEFLDFIYYNTVSTVKPGGCRYGFILSENGIVYDDGVLVRLDESRFIVSCSSSHVAGVYGMMEEWRQDRFPTKKIFIHNATAETATFTVTGPKAREVIRAAGIEADLADEGFRHMTTRWGRFAGHELRLTRVSFTGDRSYELSVRQDLASGLWQKLAEATAEFKGGLVGIEAIMILRAEKGFIVIGKDSDGMTRPGDLGLSGPLRNKKTEFIGRRSLLQDEAQRPDRNQLVGLVPSDGLGLLPIGAHGIDLSGGAPRSIGYVTSSYDSVSLPHPVALGLIERGASRHGEEITLQHLGQRRRARITPPCAFDPEGERLNA
ncbi:2Fe-2S iron-sulfur cluster-binding protein [Pseudogemmobacter faecipullorum]|uniref:(2Fe-2S)-binding protein n=1 Tax=Pseudogemmobacter faecipullorum TaxID=2755041 RepID=A0ABS8CM93_9RHOB|nr:2Fe-2S iron-sulfur cluster-binding protein [Pseudogemmobacter faecipullorum]MCB5410340.1 (2Fe-2S)-binding protein [Pseudogemmobacter faecipullorum]